MNNITLYQKEVGIEIIDTIRKSFNDFPQNIISIDLTLPNKIDRLTRLKNFYIYPNDIVYIVSRKAFRIPFKLIRIRQVRRDIGIFPLEHYDNYYVWQNLETGEIFENNDFLRKIERIERYDNINNIIEIIQLRDPFWYKNILNKLNY